MEISEDSNKLIEHSPSPKKPGVLRVEESHVDDVWGSYDFEPGVRCNNLCKNGQLVGKPPGVNTIWDAFQNGLCVNPKGNCLGWRDGNEYKWWTFAEVAEKVTDLVRALATTPLKRQDRVGILGKASPIWVAISLACTARSLVVLPLSELFDAKTCHDVINKTELSLLFVDDSEAARRVLSTGELPVSLRTIVILQDPAEDVVSMADKEGVTLVTLDELLLSTPDDSKSSKPVHDLPKPEDIYQLWLSSGTNGNPKITQLTHEAIVANVNSVDLYYSDWVEGQRFTKENVAMGCVPIAHGFAQILINWFLYRGAAYGFFSGDYSRLMDDAQILKPTFFPVMPAIMNRIYANIVIEVSKSLFKSKMFWYCYQRKKEALSRGIITRDSIWDKLVFNRVQTLLGGRVIYVSVGVAPKSEKVCEFWSVVFGAVVTEGVGFSEAPCTTLDGHPLQCNYLKVNPLPEFGPNAGEICVKGFNVMTGYYKEPERTTVVLDKDGWLRTGEIGEFLPDGKLKVIGSKEGMVQLANGTFINPEKVENTFLTSFDISQIFVDGISSESYLVAIVIPEPSAAKQFADEHRLDAKTVINSPQYKKFILDGLTNVGKEHNLTALEQVKSICLSDEPFSVTNGLKTSTWKNKRPALRKHFQDKIEAMYKVGPMVEVEAPRP